jgi:polysaccharide export outer membrane protein
MDMRLSTSLGGLVAALVAAFLAESAVCQDVAGESTGEKTREYYRIAPGDMIQIVVAERPDLTVQIRVPLEGRVMLPVTGSVEVVGRGVEELAADIAHRLETDARLVDARVAVSIVAYGVRRVYLGGSVGRPQALDLPAEVPLTLMQAVSSCGGFREDADREEVRITRRRAGEAPQVVVADMERIAEGDAPELDPVLEPGDSVYIPAREPVYVLGQVSKAGAYPLPYGYSFTASKAVALAGGFTKFARYTRVRVTRRTPEGIEQFVVDLGAVLSGGRLENDIDLEAGDTVYVPERVF